MSVALGVVSGSNGPSIGVWAWDANDFGSRARSLRQNEGRGRERRRGIMRSSQGSGADLRDDVAWRLRILTLGRLGWVYRFSKGWCRGWWSLSSLLWLSRNRALHYSHTCVVSSSWIWSELVRLWVALTNRVTKKCCSASDGLRF